MALTIWHNPRCSTSRRTLELLREHGAEPEIRLYLQYPPDAAEIAAALRLLGQPALALLRRKEPLAADLGPDTPEAELIAAMAAHPILIERPLVLAQNRAALGRPPEAVLPLLSH